MNEKESKDIDINKTIKPFLEEQDAEETYWFIRWVVLSRKYNKLKAFVKTIQDLDVVEVRKENVNLMSELKTVKENYARVKEELAAFRGQRQP